MRAWILRTWPRLVGLGALVLIAGLAVGYRHAWWPEVSARARALAHGATGASAGKQPAEAHDDHDHDHDDHGHAHDDHDHDGHDHAHDESNALALSPEARRNLGLTPDRIQPVALQDYVRTFTVPAIVVEQPGRTHVQVSAPLTGVVTAVHATPGEAVTYGALLFELRLTHEDLVQAQVDFLKTLAELDVEEQEIERLRPLVERGAIAATVTREREYAAARARALLSAQREALRLHGLSEVQVDQIVAERRLLREVQVVVPSPDFSVPEELRLSGSDLAPVSLAAQETPRPAPLVVQELRVHKGQALTAGETMCVLADYSELYIQGAAFEQDGPALTQAVERGWKVDAVLHRPSAQPEVLAGLDIVYLATEVDVESRILHFYVRLRNELLSPAPTVGSRFVNWRFRPGQRLQVRVPVETWQRQIVLPVDAVTRDGAEQYVFVENGSHFDRVPVHVLHRDQLSVVVAHDGALFPGDRVALTGAHQMQMALKNKSGGAVDPHAGHNH